MRMLISSLASLRCPILGSAAAANAVSGCIANGAAEANGMVGRAGDAVGGGCCEWDKTEGMRVDDVNVGRRGVSVMSARARERATNGWVANRGDRPSATSGI